MFISNGAIFSLAPLTVSLEGAAAEVELTPERVARPGRRMRQVCAGTQVHYEQRVSLSWKANECAGQGVGCTGTPVHYEQTAMLRFRAIECPGQGGGCGDVYAHTGTL